MQPPQSDRYVLIGNHRDAMVYGAVDPSSSTSQILEVVRVLGTFLKEGWRPRRTIVVCSWGAEEFRLIGSTEWVEENVDKLQSRAVGYINSDSCGVGPEFYVLAKSSIVGSICGCYKTGDLLTFQIPGIKDSSKTLFQEWREYGERYRPNATEYPIVNALAAVSDQSSFSFYAGIPSTEFFFNKMKTKHSSLYSSYHTGYETFYMVTTFIDPEFKIHEACGRLSILSLKYLADSSILPYSLGRFPSIMMSNLQNNKNRERLIQMYDKYIELENSKLKI
ncbi:hypothetical protein Anas_04287 [Armadillidium nasatum]|uniref:Peptidase M28 domain-containing protein n=1 Tax=Armadillidium nasatum TaxID=96803 RepID=A0A5N5SPK7_9CRUS|nr:hypothetical protein Anas_04287 [Armadillidium nasatum]